MDDSTRDMVKAVAEAVQSFAGLAEKLFGSPFEQAGGLIGDTLKHRRDLRKIKFFTNLQKVLSDAGIEPKQIPDNIWVPAVQQVLLEDDETLHHKWANLLVNSIDPVNDVRTTYVEMLKALGPREVKFLDALFDEHSRGRRFTSDYSQQELASVYTNAGLSRVERVTNVTVGELERNRELIQAESDKWHEMLGIVLREGILALHTQPKPIEIDPSRVPGGQLSSRTLTLNIKSEERFAFTELGRAFIKTCRRPSTDRQKDG